MNLSITLPDGTAKTAKMIPNTLQLKDEPADTTADFVLPVRMASARSGSCTVYVDASFTASDVISLAAHTGQGTIRFGAPVNVDYAVVSVAMRSDPPQAFLAFSGMPAEEA